MERQTPEFQLLTQKQQEARRWLLSLMLGSLLEKPSPLGLIEKETIMFANIMLEFHLTGRIERFEQKPKNPKK